MMVYCCVVITLGKEITMAIEGQFKVDGRDSDLLTLYDDVTWLRLLVVT
jgi:hypothetical protein